MSDSRSIPSEGQPYDYWAFISYSHQDNLRTRGGGSGDHIEWANWLHEQLETFRIPDGFLGRTTRTGEPMPERFFPAFRDEAELPTSHDLGGQIHAALKRSRFLIVIASPRSAQSRYVNEEVRYFRQIGRGDRILTLIVDGEPNVRIRAKVGWAAEQDCFCPALVHPLDASGNVDDAALLAEEPIAADVRVKDVEPSREMRVGERDRPDRLGLLGDIRLKLIAGLMGVGLDELVQRDRRRTEQELFRTRRDASRTEFLFARQMLDLKEYRKAHARLAKAIRLDPENRAAIVLGVEAVKRTGNRGALRLLSHEAPVDIAVFSPDGARVLTASRNTARLWDVGSASQPALTARRGTCSTRRDCRRRGLVRRAAGVRVGSVHRVARGSAGLGVPRRAGRRRRICRRRGRATRAAAPTSRGRIRWRARSGLACSGRHGTSLGPSPGRTPSTCESCRRPIATTRRRCASSTRTSDPARASGPTLGTHLRAAKSGRREGARRFTSQMPLDHARQIPHSRPLRRRPTKRPGLRVQRLPATIPGSETLARCHRHHNRSLPLSPANHVAAHGRQKRAYQRAGAVVIADNIFTHRRLLRISEFRKRREKRLSVRNTVDEVRSGILGEDSLKVLSREPKAKDLHLLLRRLRCRAFAALRITAGLLALACAGDPPVSSVVVSPQALTLRVAATVQLTAVTLDAAGNTLVGRTVTWSSSNPAVATVSATGLVTGVSPGIAIITASSEGKSGSSQVVVVTLTTTSITDIHGFLDHCPTSDPAYARIVADFDIRLDGQPITAATTCTEPIATLPIAQFTDRLVAYQILRTAYYMDTDTRGRLPWTPNGLYTWMASNIGGVNLKSAPGLFFCCELINGKKYFAASIQDATQREFKRTWLGISGSLGFYAHEIRHADPGAPGHVTGCLLFPLPTDALGCDSTYDLNNLGSYGVQYWLESSWATGALNIGIGCAPGGIPQQYAEWHRNSANSFRGRFVTNVPPVVVANAPYGGPCPP